MVLTKPQRQAIYKLYCRDSNGHGTYKAFRKKVQQGYDCIMIHWCNMWVGIEADGYTHT